MKPLKGSRTEANLMAAFAGETQARTKYTYYASQAKKDGYVQISKIFEETAANEKEHAKIWFKLLHGGAMPATTENLKDAAAGEHFEWADMYREFAEQARQEGFDQIAALFEAVGQFTIIKRIYKSDELFSIPCRNNRTAVIKSLYQPFRVIC